MSSVNRNLFECVDVHNDLTCVICMDLLCDPVELKPCGHLLCTGCVGSLRLCPTCRGDIGSRSVPNRVIRNMIEEAINVKCKRCGWRGNRAASAAHAAASCAGPTAGVLSQPNAQLPILNAASRAAAHGAQQHSDIEWDCTVCTFQNSMASSVCVMCASGRRPPHLPPRNQSPPLAIPAWVRAPTTPLGLKALLSELQLNPNAQATEVRDAFVAMSAHATTSDAVVNLSVAICGISDSAMQSTFGTPAVHDAFVAMSAHATTSDAVRWLSGAIGSITSSDDAAIQSTFGTPAVRDAFLAMSAYATTSDAVFWLSSAICNITSSGYAAIKSTFGTPAVRDALVTMSTHATTSSAVQWLSTAINNITNGNDAAIQFTFGTPAVRDALVAMPTHATTSDAVRWLSGAICNITNCDDAAIMSTFRTQEVRDALVAMSTHATTSDAVRWLSTAISNITNCDDAAITIIGTAGVRDALVAMSMYASSSDAVHWLSSVINNIACGPGTAIRMTFGTAVVCDALFAMSPRANMATRQLLEYAIDSITSACPDDTSGNHEPYVPWRTGGARTPWGRDVRRLVLLGNRDAAEVADCTNLVQPFLPRGRVVTAVERVENALLYSRFLTKKSQIASENNDDANCAIVFHGTSTSCPRAIALDEHGIDLRYSTRGYFGIASYFSHRVEYVMSYASEVAGSQTALQFLVCEVARGKVEGPAVRNNARKRPSAGCHCVEGDVSDDPAQVFMATMCYEVHQAYPRYLVTVNVRAW